MNAVKQATQPKIQSYFKLLKTSLKKLKKKKQKEKKKAKHIRSKHTHTQNKFNQFYISKTS